MAFEWAMLAENVGDDESIIAALQEDYEPFAVWGGVVYFKRRFFGETSEAKSSTKHSNWAGNPPDEKEDDD